MVRISNLDLLELLMQNSRMSFVKLARILNVSETAIRKRMRKLEQEGVIRKYTVDVDPRKIGYEINALIGIDTKPEHYIQILDKLNSNKDVISLYSSSGDHMIMLNCWFKNSKELMKFTKDLGKKEGVTKICPAIILEKIK